MSTALYEQTVDNLNQILVDRRGIAAPIHQNWILFNA
jgi:hypothetical protein